MHISMHLPSFSFKALRVSFRPKSHRFSLASDAGPPFTSTASRTSSQQPHARPPTPYDEPKPHAAVLPYEILQLIFAMAVEASSSDIDLEEKYHLRADALAFSQVCGQWRYAAQGHSILWVHSIDFQRHPPQAVAYYLHLSRPRPIDVGHRSAPLRISGHACLAILNSLKADRHRVRQWNVDLARDFQYMNLQYLFGLSNDTVSLPVHTLRQTGVINLPGDCWQRLVCSLERLSLCDTNLVLTSSLALSNLTELSIISTRVGSVKYRITEMVTLLRRTPRLQFLRLQDTIRLTARDDLAILSQATASVSLPDTRLISFSESNWRASYLFLLMLPVLQRPPHCGLNLALPSFDPFEPGLQPMHETMGALRRARRTTRDSWSSQSMIAPRVEMAFQSRSNHTLQFSMGTVSSPKETLDWNGTSGSIGVHRYLDGYFKASSLRPFTVLHPPLSVTLDNPSPLDISKTACFLNADVLSATRSIRISIGLSKAFPRHAEGASRLIPTALYPARQVTAMTLDEEASMIVLNGLQDKTYLDSGRGPWPVPYLPKLKFIAIESTRPRVGEMGYFGEEMRAQTLLIVQEYVEWRGRIGYPVEVLWSGSVSNCEEGVEFREARKSKRNGMVSIPMTTRC